MTTNGSPTGEPDEAERVDEEALALRLKGRAFSAIARKLGMQRASDANRAFIRALRRRTSAERDAIRNTENERLDKLVGAVNANGELTAEESDRRLRTIASLRARLMRD